MMRVVPEAAWLYSSPPMMSEVVIICPTHAWLQGGRSQPTEETGGLIIWHQVQKFQNSFEISDYVAKVWEIVGST